MTVLKLVTVSTGLVVAGEALVLLVGMHFLSGSDNPWNSLKNDLLLTLDILAGTVLIVLALSSGLNGPWPWGAVGVALLAHLWRDVEYLAYFDNPFCINLPLFVVNNLKIVGLIAILLLLF
jgi:hypothetical protein